MCAASKPRRRASDFDRAMAELSYCTKKLSSRVAPILFAGAAMLATTIASAVGTADINDHAFLEAQAPIGAAKDTTPKYRYLFGAPAKWSGPMHWKYNHANAPASLAGNKAAVIAQLRSSLDKWTAQCGVAYVYDGETTVRAEHRRQRPGPRLAAGQRQRRRVGVARSFDGRLDVRLVRAEWRRPYSRRRRHDAQHHQHPVARRSRQACHPRVGPRARARSLERRVDA